MKGSEHKKSLLLNYYDDVQAEQLSLLNEDNTADQQTREENGKKK